MNGMLGAHQERGRQKSGPACGLQGGACEAPDEAQAGRLREDGNDACAPLQAAPFGPGRLAAPSFVAGSLCGRPHGLTGASAGTATRPGAGPDFCRPRS
ncbi:hypothetical protein GCM10007320_61900 [Pseudorhodoferax aquiterrae]|uniref:Uncharacterized protein n=1 Tax=Pseudorhodoferax aquiterrae TaxID=747304 RepID=A0ABQ3GDW4_9BURK|nr:hypothetical protein GCM10007320_61900 [Pseudorhodoferax aquiterrae]